ncbi:coiled-coil domain-containing protein 42 homolog [Aethina tumida]|uniref:coiled-coil domain-containing protein 42 homolog n=1 Tax=Aethina tumida TaxID=116153 RepID=UPI00096B4999|nr:coiled-coil domain-containing protein 42 homolog [Aethina tumida]
MVGPKSKFEISLGPTYEYILDTIKSKNFRVILSKYHEQLGTIHCGDPLILLTNSIEDLRRTERELEKYRQDQQLKKVELQKEYEDFEKKEETLRNNFIRFNKFIKENKEKRERGQVKIEEDNLLTEQRQEALDKVMKKFNHNQMIRTKLEEQIKKHNIYEKFFMNVCEESGGMFNQPSDMIERYECLLETRNTLTKKQENDLIELENAKANMNKLAEEKNLIIIGLNTKMFGLEARYENSRYRAQLNENLIMEILEKAADRVEEIYGTRRDIYQIYTEMNKAKKNCTSYAGDDFENQLAFIKNTLAHFYKMNTSRSSKKKIMKPTI